MSSSFSDIVSEINSDTSDVISIVRDLATVIQAISEAAQSKPQVDIKTILPSTMLTTIAKTAADIRAKQKYGE